MKLYHAAALALVLAFGYLATGCTRRPPSSTWHIVEAPRRTCIGPNDPWLRWPNSDQCFDLAAALSKWTKVETPWLWTGWRIYYPRAYYKSMEDCWNHLSVMITGRLPPVTLFGYEPAPPRYLMCIAADDPRLAKNKGPYDEQ